MAVIGALSQIEKLFNSKELKVVFDYLKEAAMTDSTVHKRIFSKSAGYFERLDLSRDVFALEQVYYTKDRKDCFFESHKKYIDFQLHLGGIEQMEWVDVNRLNVKNEYDVVKDLIIYRTIDETSKIVMHSNQMAIYFPEDGHMGLPAYDEKADLVYKTVVKFPLSMFNV